VGLLSFALIAPQPCHTHRRAQFPRFCLLLTRDRERTVEMGFRLCRIGLARHQRDFPTRAIDLSFAPPFLCRFHRGDRFANAAPGFIELVEFRVGYRRI
jgi:hypothetical protein